MVSQSLPAHSIACPQRPLSAGTSSGGKTQRSLPVVLRFSALADPCWSPFHGCREKTDDTSGEDNDEKEAVTSKGRKTANSQGRRKGRITRSMANEANHEEAAAPQQSSELGKQGLGTRRGWEELGHTESGSC